MAQRLAGLALVCAAIAAIRFVQLSRRGFDSLIDRGATRPGGARRRGSSLTIHWGSRALQGAAVVGVLVLSPSLLAGRTSAGSPALQAAVAIDRISVPVSSAQPLISDAAGSTVAGDATASDSASASAQAAAATAEPQADAAPDSAPEPPASPSSASAPASVPQRYTVQPGDTMKGIAAAYGFDPTALARANGISDPDFIQVGQRLSLTVTAATGTTRQPADSNEAFILSLVKGAQESQRLTGVPSSVTIAQAILETYWGSSYLAREANNYFGIKAYAKPGTDGVVWIDAWEVDANGNDVTTQEPFRKYDDPAESLVDHGKFFIENSRYASALEAASDPREFARRINRAGYATDPAYASKLISYMDRYNLYQWDLAQ